MNYMEKFELWFDRTVSRFLASGDTKVFQKAVKDKILESYRNGQRAGRAKKSETTSKQD